jgi:putative PIN family toxin of toxin-antitoxin system
MAGDRSRLRVFVDANILVAGTVWPRWPYEVLQHALKADFKLVLSPYVLTEARRTLAARFPREMDRFEEFLIACDYETADNPTADAVAAHAGLVRDIADVPVVLAAIEAQVDCLVSEDKDLTVRDGSTVELHRQMTVYLSGAFLREVMGWSSEQLEAVRGRRWQDL